MVSLPASSAAPATNYSRRIHMSVIAPWLAVLLIAAFASYHRYSLAVFAALAGSALVACGLLGAEPTSLAVAAGLLAVVVLPLLITPIRRHLITSPLLGFYTRSLPPLSATERTALEAGTVGFEGQLFSGKPDWNLLLSQPKPMLTDEEQAFLDGPVEELCTMVNDWEITHVHADLQPELWDFIKKNKFFGMIIPKEYGGLGFSALANHKVIQKLASVSSVVSSTVGVPNSLGPGELLMHYGTQEQKDYYLPRLADGREVPCFSLTGLAFRMYDPDKLLGDQADIGITLALLPRDTPGVEVGRRAMPLNTPFQNGPVRGKEVFIPLSQLIGGEEMAGKGWQMLVECLSIGRSITLPSTASGGSKMGAVVTGAYARIRKQFGLSVGRFEGVEEALSRIAGNAYAISALSEAAAAAVWRGELPAVPSTIAKYHCTEMSRQLVSDAMDVHGGKGIILGPQNYLGRAWQATPISITVEGANIMTRSLMIFGQGAILCHPFVLKEMKAATNPDHAQGLRDFDHLLFGHIGAAISNAVRSLWFGITNAAFGAAPGDAHTKRFYRKLNRYSAALALCADVSMLTLGGKLKFKEKLSGRLGDVLSQLYIICAILKRYEDQGRPVADQPLVAYSVIDAVYKMESALSTALRNFPIRPVGWALWLLVFPFGRRATAPSDRLGRRVAALLMSPNEARDRLPDGVFTTPCANNPAGRINSYLTKVVLAEPVERKFQKAMKDSHLSTLDFEAQLDEGMRRGVINAEERRQLEELRVMTIDTIRVDDFEHAELVAASSLKGANGAVRAA